MFKNRFENLSQLHQSLYKRALGEANQYLTSQPSQVAAYAKTYSEWLPDIFTSTTRDKLHQACVEADHVLFGDFHTLRQTQRALSRLLYQIRNYHPSRGLVLALECFYSEDQKYLDDYQEGKLEDLEFLNLISYHKKWGFSWKNYKRLLTTCKNLNIPVVAINKKFENNSLENRDNHAAQILSETTQIYPEHTVFTLIGENHLSQSHLPQSICDYSTISKPTITKIITNVDKYYFALRDNQKTHGSEYLDLGNKTFCIINTPPWIKWKSLTMWEEMKGIVDTIDEADFDHDESNEDEDLYTEITYDVDSSFINMAYEILNFLKIDISDSLRRKLENFRIIYLNDFEDFTKEKGIYFDEKHELDILEKCQKEGVVYVQELRLIIIAELNANQIAEAAGHHIFATMSPKPNELSEHGNLLYESLKFATGLFTAKIFNPKRGFMILENYQNFLNLNGPKSLKGRAKEKRVISKAVIKLHNQFSNLKDNIFPTSILITDRVTYGGLARGLGQIIGYRLFCQALEKTNDPLFLNEILTSPFDNEREVVVKFLMLWNYVPPKQDLKKIS